MSAPYGVTPVGFVEETATEIKTDLDTAFKAMYGASIGSNPDGSIPAATSIGQEIALIVDGASSLWQVIQGLYASFDPDAAGFPQLDILCALTGTTRKLATYSVVTCALTGTVGASIPATVAATVTGTNGARFNGPSSTVTLATIAAAWSTNATYPVGFFVTNSGHAYACVTAGTSANAGPGPTGTSLATKINDNTAQWQYIGASTVGAALALFTAVSPGPVGATYGQLPNIATPVVGWTAMANLADATLGQAQETDSQLRARRQLELAAGGGGTADSIRAFILSLPTTAFPIKGTVVSCSVFVNSTNAVVDGIPAHGVEVLIYDTATGAAEDQILANAVWSAVGAGIATGGGITKTVTDASGNAQTVSFTRPTQIPIYVAAVARFDTTVWGSGAGAQTAVEQACTAALLNFGLAYPVGESVRASPISAAIEGGVYAVHPDGTPIVPAPAGSPAVPGILEVRNGAGADGTLPYIGVAPGPVTSTAIAITKRQIAVIPTDGSTVTITATSEAP